MTSKALLFAVALFLTFTIARAGNKPAPAVAATAAAPSR
jgi:hypothetical protein